MATLSQALRHHAPTSAFAFVDLRLVEFIDVFAMVGLACLIASRAEDGHATEVVAPRGKPAVYLSRMGFQSFLDRYGVAIDRRLPSIRRHDQSGFLVELTPFDDTYGAERVANLVWRRLEGNVDPGVVIGMHEGTSELGANVHEHAQSPVGGFVAAQTFRRNQPDESLLIAVGDSGVGLAGTLTRSLGPISDEEAVEKAFERDVTGTDDLGRGQGLADVVEFAHTYGGTVMVHSGHGNCTVRGGQTRTQAVSHFPGTLIGARVPCRPRQGRRSI